MPRGPSSHPPGQGFAPGRDRLVGHPPLDILGQRPARVVTVLGPKRHGLEADRLPRFIDGGINTARWLKVAAPYGLQDLGHIAFDRRLTREQAIQGRAQAVNIAPRSQRLQIALGLLWAHIGRRAQRAARHRLGRAAGRRRQEHPLARQRVALAGRLGQPPVHHQSFTMFADDDVAWLQIPVEHATGMRIIDRVADIREPP